jgi:hypothetical protein
LEATMKKEIVQDNKARFELFEWVGGIGDKLVWAVAGAAVALLAVYLVS